MRSSFLLMLVFCGCPHSQVEPTTKPTPTTKIPDDSLLQGTWEIQIPGGPMGGAVIRWKFEAGAYTLSGYPALSGTGKYKVASTDGTKLLLEFSAQTGDFSQFNTMEVAADPSTQTLTLRGQGPYRKIVAP